jgi:hypothetical protein
MQYQGIRRGTLYPHKLAITSPTSGGRSVGIVRSRTQTIEFIFFYLFCFLHSCYKLILVLRLLCGRAACAHVFVSHLHIVFFTFEMSDYVN